MIVKIKVENIILEFLEMIFLGGYFQELLSKVCSYKCLDWFETPGTV
jgi:hypothetical protein